MQTNLYCWNIHLNKINLNYSSILNIFIKLYLFELVYIARSFLIYWHWKIKFLFLFLISLDCCNHLLHINYMFSNYLLHCVQNITISQKNIKTFLLRNKNFNIPKIYFNIYLFYLFLCCLYIKLYVVLYVCYCLYLIKC